MLQAQNGRQLNLAATVIENFFQKRGVTVKHSEALQLVSQLLGYASYHAARAGLEGTPKGQATDVTTWRNLAHAIGTLDESQLDMEVQLTEGCDSEGNATFTCAEQLILANSPLIEAGATAFTSKQPILLVSEFEGRDADGGDDNDDAEADENEYRVGMQLECATDQPASLAAWHIQRKGLEDAIDDLNSEFGINISLGNWVAYSEAKTAFWNKDVGFVSEKASATGFESKEHPPALADVPDLELVLYSDAADVNPDEHN